jgi:hypothetical protein
VSFALSWVNGTFFVSGSIHIGHEASSSTELLAFVISRGTAAEETKGE